MYLDSIFRLFRKPSLPAGRHRLTIPHPRSDDPENQVATIYNVNLEAVLNDWFIRWHVPPGSYDFFRAIKITLDDTIKYPAYASGNTLVIKPRFANAAVLSHEFSHIVYRLLSLEQKKTFAVEYKYLLTTDPLMILLDAQESYINTNDIEAYAEIYRFLGEKMHPSLRKYYPKFF